MTSTKTPRFMRQKFEELSWQHVVALLGVVVAALVAWVAWLYRAPSDSAAAWVQAIISGVAIFTGFGVVWVQGEMKRRDDISAEREMVRRTCVIFQTEIAEACRAVQASAVGRRIAAGRPADLRPITIAIRPPPTPVYDHHAIEVGRIPSDSDRKLIVSTYGTLSALILAFETHNIYLAALRKLIEEVPRKKGTKQEIEKLLARHSEHDKALYLRYGDLCEKAREVAELTP